MPTNGRLFPLGSQFNARRNDDGGGERGNGNRRPEHGVDLRSKRREIGNPLPDPLDWELVRRVRRLYSAWSVDLRYRDWAAPADEAQCVYDDVTWLRDVRLRLWS